jgi:hypothetical protein
MSEYCFAIHDGHLAEAADKIARKHGARHVNHTDPGTKKRRGWFACRNEGRPYDQDVEARVMAEIAAAGGIERLALKSAGRLKHCT